MLWDLYIKYKEGLIKRQFSVSIMHPKGGKIVWTCVKDDIIKENNNYEAIGLSGFDYKLFEEEEGRGVIDGLYGYPYLKHILKLWIGDWVKQMKN